MYIATFIVRGINIITYIICLYFTKPRSYNIYTYLFNKITIAEWTDANRLLISNSHLGPAAPCGFNCINFRDGIDVIIFRYSFTVYIYIVSPEFKARKFQTQP